MRTEGALKRLFQRTRLHFKSMGILFWVPLVLSHVLIPLLVLLTYLEYGVGGEMGMKIIQFTLLLMPFCACWWSLFAMQEYVEGDGNELLYVCRGKIKTADLLCPFLLFLASVALHYLVYIYLLPPMGMELLRVVCVSVFYIGCTYLLIFLSKSVAITLMVLLIYTLGNFIFRTGTVGQVVFPLYFDLNLVSESTLLWVCLPMVVMGILLCLIGMLCNRRKLHFN